mmetsp:Transcript_1563/g.5424  ORF Transcript_1563/g.5424 Transcript_1563/m.5424 type:complete len:229 (+) Transcript_1563:2240-2926(+)
MVLDTSAGFILHLTRQRTRGPRAQVHARQEREGASGGHAGRGACQRGACTRSDGAYRPCLGASLSGTWMAKVTSWKVSSETPTASSRRMPSSGCFTLYRRSWIRMWICRRASSSSSENTFSRLLPLRRLRPGTVQCAELLGGSTVPLPSLLSPTPLAVRVGSGTSTATASPPCVSTIFDMVVRPTPWAGLPLARQRFTSSRHRGTRLRRWSSLRLPARPSGRAVRAAW